MKHDQKKRRKKVLMLASVASMIDQFNMPNIHLLQEMGYEVHVAKAAEKLLFGCFWGKAGSF